MLDWRASDKATSELLPAPDILTNLEICDLVRSKQAPYGRARAHTLATRARARRDKNADEH